MTQTSDTLLRLQDVSKRFGKKTALDHISLEIAPGRMVGLLGSNGSGKSTLLRCINLLETPTNGKVLFHGSDITAKGSDPCAYRAIKIVYFTKRGDAHAA